MTDEQIMAEHKTTPDDVDGYISFEHHKKKVLLDGLFTSDELIRISEKGVKHND